MNGSSPQTGPQADLRLEPDGRIKLVLRGLLDEENTGACWRDLEQRFRSLRATALEIDASELDVRGGIGMSLLSYLCLGGMTPGVEVTLRGLKPELGETLDTFRAEDLSSLRQRPVKAPLLQELGRTARIELHDVFDQIAFLGRAVAALGSAVLAPRQLRWSTITRIFEMAGVNALPIVSMISFLVGLIIASETAHRLAFFGAQILVAGIVAFSFIRDLGPLVTAILLAGRSGSAFAAELGTMKINEELDALTTMGLDPIRFLVVPRLIAGIFLMPLLTLYAMFMGMAGGTMVMVIFGFSVQEVLNEMAANITLSDIWLGLSKSFIFGAIVAGVGCQRGLQTGTGAIAVGVSTTRAVVTSILLIIVADTIFATTNLLLR